MSRRQRRSDAKRRRRAHARIVAASGLGMAASLAAPGAALADDFTVNIGGDAGDGACDPIPNECTLRDALDDSRNNDNAPEVDRILFEASVTGTITAAAAEFPQIDEPMQVIGPGASVLTVSGGATRRALTVSTPVVGTAVDISGLTLTGHRTVEGGALFNKYGNLTLDGVTVTNSATTSDDSPGGGIFSTQGELTIRNSTISGNSTDGEDAQGGGIRSFDGALTIENSTISGNSTTGDGAFGGGISANAGTLTIENSTITGNSMQTGNGPGGIDSYQNADATLTNTIVADNSAPGTPDLWTVYSDVELSFTLVGDPSDAEITETVVGSNLLGVDPQLGPLADNGGPTRTHALSTSSLAVDKGMATGTDQRGTARPFDIAAIGNGTAAGANAADIGAFELNTQARCKGKPETVLGITGTPGADVIVGTAGKDVIRALGGNDLVCAGAGNDTVIGGAGKDELRGEAGKDTLKGGPGKDKLFGLGGKDKLLGGPAKDKLVGGPGKDTQSQ